MLLVILNNGFDLFHSLGRETAEKQTEFPVLILPSSNSDLAIIRNYGDYLYAVPFNHDTNKFEQKFYIVKMSEMAKTPLVYKKVGQLHPVEVKQ